MGSSEAMSCTRAEGSEVSDKVVQRARVERGSQFYCITLQYNYARSLVALLPPPCMLDTLHYCELKSTHYEQCRSMG